MSTQQEQEAPAGTDVVAELLDRHVAQEELLRRWNALPPGDGARGPLAERIVAAVVSHVEVEEARFYPSLAEAPEGSELQDARDGCLDQHRELRELADVVRRSGPEAGAVDAAIARLSSALRGHMNREDVRLLPLVRTSLPAAETRRLGTELRQAEREAAATTVDGGGELGAQFHMRLWRGDASGGRFRDYRVPAQDGEVVLDVVHRIQATQANDLAVRWNCKAGKCGSCSAEINGYPRLMCMTRMSTFAVGEPITVSPIRTYPIIKDLVTDVSYNYAIAKTIPPFKPRPKDPKTEADGHYRIAQRDIDRGQEFRKCIECWLCMNVCHVIRNHEENKQRYGGPRFFIRLAELEMHPLDTADRRDAAQEDLGLGLCNITKCCTEVCPEGIHITDNGIIPMKERVVDRKYDPIAILGARSHRTRPTV